MRCRHGSVAVLAVLAGCGGGEPARQTERATPTPRPLSEPSAADRAFRALERSYAARVGVYAIDTGSGREVAHRAGERFPVASTFKALAAGAMLRAHGLAGLAESVPIKRLVDAYSPVTERRVGSRMTLEALCSAAVRSSDNTAANLLLDRLGGPAGLDRTLERVVGDDVTHLERPEPDLNVWEPGDPRDTSTPRALARDLRAFALGDVLEPPERARLVRWLRTNTTGAGLIRAAAPKGAVVGDKTGTGATYGARNDIAVVWPRGGAPIVIAVLTNRRAVDAEPDDELLARAASAAFAALR